MTCASKSSPTIGSGDHHANRWACDGLSQRTPVLAAGLSHVDTADRRVSSSREFDPSDRGQCYLLRCRCICRASHTGRRQPRTYQHHLLVCFPWLAVLDSSSPFRVGNARNMRCSHHCMVADRAHASRTGPRTVLTHRTNQEAGRVSPPSPHTTSPSRQQRLGYGVLARTGAGRLPH